MTLTPHTFDFVRRLVFERSGIVLGSDKDYLVAARLAPLVRQAGLSGIDALVDWARNSADRGLAESLVEALLTGETKFFRDPQVFDKIARHLIPQMLSERRAGRALHVWSAACASGQEAYSLAILFHDRFAQFASGWDLRVTASDLSTAMLERARLGRYSRLEVSRGLSDDQLRRHFRQEGDLFHVSQRLKSSVEFRQINLIQPWPQLAPVDLVFLRNVLIYMEPPTRRRILDRLPAVMRPGAYVVLGTAEATFDAGAALQAVDCDGLRCLRLAGDAAVRGKLPRCK